MIFDIYFKGLTLDRWIMVLSGSTCTAFALEHLLSPNCCLQSHEGEGHMKVLANYRNNPGHLKPRVVHRD